MLQVMVMASDSYESVDQGEVPLLWASPSSSMSTRLSESNKRCDTCGVMGDRAFGVWKVLQFPTKYGVGGNARCPLPLSTVGHRGV